MTFDKSYLQDNINSRKTVEREVGYYYMVGFYYDSSIDDIICNRRSVTLIDGEFVCHNIGYPAGTNKNSGRIIWHINGMSYICTRNYCEACGFDEETTMFWLLKYGESLPHRMLQTPGVSVVITHD